jgi:hypothetical protein
MRCVRIGQDKAGRRFSGYYFVGWAFVRDGMKFVFMSMTVCDKVSGYWLIFIRSAAAVIGFCLMSRYAWEPE